MKEKKNVEDMSLEELQDAVCSLELARIAPDCHYGPIVRTLRRKHLRFPFGRQPNRRDS